MTRIDWDKDRRQRLTDSSKRHESDEDAARLRAVEQASYLKIAKKHQHVNAFCGAIVQQAKHGRPISKGQAAILMKVAQEQRAA